MKLILVIGTNFSPPPAGERRRGERAWEGGQAGGVAGRLLAAGLHPAHRQDAQGATQHRPRREDRLHRAPGGEGQGQLHEEAAPLRLN